MYLREVRNVVQQPARLNTPVGRCGAARQVEALPGASQPPSPNAPYKRCSSVCGVKYAQWLPGEFEVREVELQKEIGSCQWWNGLRHWGWGG